MRSDKKSKRGNGKEWGEERGRDEEKEDRYEV